MARAQPLADLIAPCLGKALAAQGFAAADILVSWPEIAGERLAAVSHPLRLERVRSGSAHARTAGPEPTGGAGSRPHPAVLVVRVEGAFALEVQHLAPVLVERINAHYGWRCVGRIALKQGPVRRRAAPSEPPRLLSEAERQSIRKAVDPVEDDALRTALEALGRAILTDERRA